MRKAGKRGSAVVPSHCPGLQGQQRDRRAPGGLATLCAGVGNPVQVVWESYHFAEQSMGGVRLLLLSLLSRPASHVCVFIPGFPLRGELPANGGGSFVTCLLAVLAFLSPDRKQGRGRGHDCFTPLSTLGIKWIRRLCAES